MAHKTPWYNPLRVRGLHMRMSWVTVSPYPPQGLWPFAPVTNIAATIGISKALRFVCLLAFLCMCSQALEAQQSKPVEVYVKASLADLVKCSKSQSRATLDIK